MFGNAISTIAAKPPDFGELDEVSLAYAITIHKSQTARLPEVAFVAHRAQNSKLFGLVQQRNHAQVAAQAIRQPAAARVTGVVRFTERAP